MQYTITQLDTSHFSSIYCVLHHLPYDGAIQQQTSMSVYSYFLPSSNIESHHPLFLPLPWNVRIPLERTTNMPAMFSGQDMHPDLALGKMQTKNKNVTDTARGSRVRSNVGEHTIQDKCRSSEVVVEPFKGVSDKR